MSLPWYVWHAMGFSTAANLSMLVFVFGAWVVYPLVAVGTTSFAVAALLAWAQR